MNNFNNYLSSEDEQTVVECEEYVRAIQNQFKLVDNYLEQSAEEIKNLRSMLNLLSDTILNIPIKEIGMDYDAKERADALF